MYKLLARINKFILPSFTKQKLDISKAKNWQKAILAWKYYVTIRALDQKKQEYPFVTLANKTIFAPTKKASWRN